MASNYDVHSPPDICEVNWQQRKYHTVRAVW